MDDALALLALVASCAAGWCFADWLRSICLRERKNWCWLLGHKWMTVYPPAMPDTPVNDVVAYSVCQICSTRR
jgi:hypothetical protein